MISHNTVRFFSGLVLASALLTTGIVNAEEKAPEYDHFKGKEVATLEDAVTLFSEQNAKITAILKKGEPSYADMHQIHEITYSLENALAKINTEMTALADQLEKLHKASEYAKPKESLSEGQAYLKTANSVIP